MKSFVERVGESFEFHRERFDPESVANPLEPDNLLKSSGRGIFLIRNFMDEVHLQRAPEGGMEIRMVKRVQPAAKNRWGNPPMNSARPTAMPRREAAILAGSRFSAASVLRSLPR